MSQADTIKHRYEKCIVAFRSFHKTLQISTSRQQYCRQLSNQNDRFRLWEHDVGILEGSLDRALQINAGLFTCVSEMLNDLYEQLTIDLADDEKNHRRSDATQLKDVSLQDVADLIKVAELTDSHSRGVETAYPEEVEEVDTGVDDNIFDPLSDPEDSDDSGLQPRLHRLAVGSVKRGHDEAELHPDEPDDPDFLADHGFASTQRRLRRRTNGPIHTREVSSDVPGPDLFPAESKDYVESAIAVTITEDRENDFRPTADSVLEEVIDIVDSLISLEPALINPVPSHKEATAALATMQATQQLEMDPRYRPRLSVTAARTRDTSRSSDVDVVVLREVGDDGLHLLVQDLPYKLEENGIYARILSIFYPEPHLAYQSFQSTANELVGMINEYRYAEPERPLQFVVSRRATNVAFCTIMTLIREGLVVHNTQPKCACAYFDPHTVDFRSTSDASSLSYASWLPMPFSIFAVQRKIELIELTELVAATGLDMSDHDCTIVIIHRIARITESFLDNITTHESGEVAIVRREDAFSILNGYDTAILVNDRGLSWSIVASSALNVVRDCVDTVLLYRDDLDIQLSSDVTTSYSVQESAQAMRVLSVHGEHYGAPWSLYTDVVRYVQNYINSPSTLLQDGSYKPCNMIIITGDEPEGDAEECVRHIMDTTEVLQDLVITIQVVVLGSRSRSDGFFSDLAEASRRLYGPFAPIFYLAEEYVSHADILKRILLGGISPRFATISTSAIDSKGFHKTQVSLKDSGYGGSDMSSLAGDDPSEVIRWSGSASESFSGHDVFDYKFRHEDPSPRLSSDFVIPEGTKHQDKSQDGCESVSRSDGDGLLLPSRHFRSALHPRTFNAAPQGGPQLANVALYDPAWLGGREIRPKPTPSSGLALSTMANAPSTRKRGRPTNASLAARKAEEHAPIDHAADPTTLPHLAKSLSQVSSPDREIRPKSLPSPSFLPSTVSDTPVKRKRGRPTKAAQAARKEYATQNQLSSKHTVSPPTSLARATPNTVASSTLGKTFEDQPYSTAHGRLEDSSRVDKDLEIAQERESTHLGALDSATRDADTSNTQYQRQSNLLGRDASLPSSPQSVDNLNTGLTATFLCPLCPKKFTRAYNLRAHLRTHTDERPFACNVCGRAFARQHDQRRHEQLHSNIKKYVCKGQLSNGMYWGCGRNFARLNNLARHLCDTSSDCVKPLREEEGRIGGVKHDIPTDEEGLKDLPYKVFEQYPALAKLTLEKSEAGSVQVG